jgi:hypothetical protein
VRSFDQRILKLYLAAQGDDGDSGATTRLYCLQLLERSPRADVTDAMIRHALHIDEKKGSSINEYVTVEHLQSVLNKRLGTSFRDLRDLRAYLVKRRAEEKGRQQPEP